jgi:hypothetical protein
MRAIVWLAVAWAAAGAGGEARAQGPKPDSDRDWAQRVAKDFFRALSGENYVDGFAEAAGLLSPEAARACEAHPYRAFMGEAKDYRAAVFTGVEAAPDRSEFIFSGRLTGYKWKVPQPGPPEVEFSVRVAKEAGGGRWSIRSMRIGKSGDGSDK